ncbi:MAG: phosphatase PAP2 family protein [candidate division KSB1 bacterium]|nr:phosphatase PAP2 family protein [candidate division KSB1 bacterium]
MKTACFLLVAVLSAAACKADSPYRPLSCSDGSILAGAAVIGGIASVLDRCIEPFTPTEIANLSKESVNAFDRPAIAHFSETSQKLSDWGLRVALLLPAAFAFDDRPSRDGGKIAAMYAQTLFTVGALTEITKVTVKRVRPYAYSIDPTRAEQLPRDARKSFFSGHTSAAFAAAVFSAKVYEDYHPDSRLRPVIWGGTLTLASAVGVWRVTAGKHFPSDVLAAAVVGSAVGYAIPYVHKKTSSLSLNSFPQSIVFTVSF